MRFQGAIFDVDGVLVDSPHERAWRESLQRLMEVAWTDLAGVTGYMPEKFTTEVYQAHVAGKPREAGARAALEYFVPPRAEADDESLASFVSRRFGRRSGTFTSLAAIIQIPPLLVLRWPLSPRACTYAPAAASYRCITPYGSRRIGPRSTHCQADASAWPPHRAGTPTTSCLRRKSSRTESAFCLRTSNRFASCGAVMPWSSPTQTARWLPYARCRVLFRPNCRCG